MRACAQRPGAAARVSLRRGRTTTHSGLTSLAFHACGSVSPFRARCCHSNQQQVLSALLACAHRSAPVLSAHASIRCHMAYRVCGKTSNKQEPAISYLLWFSDVPISTAICAGGGRRAVHISGRCSVDPRPAERAPRNSRRLKQANIKATSV